MTYFKSNNPVKFRSTRRNFTLVELLVVLAIVGIIIGIALPAFEKLAIGSGVDAAARMISAQLRLARDYAIIKRQKVAVIMPTTGITQDNMYACFRPALVTGTTSPFTFVSWVENTSWMFLPKGTTIMEADADPGVARITSPGPPPVIDFTIRDPVPDNQYSVSVNTADISSIGGTTGDFRCVVFSPTGRLISANDAPTYVTLGEAVYTGSWIIRNPATTGNTRSASNQITIKIDSYTGRTVSITPDQYNNAGNL